MAKRGSWSAVYDWMLELDLTASELLIYSRILSFSSSEVGGYIGKVDSLAQWGRCHRVHVHRILNKLVERGLVQKSHVKTDMGTVIKYSADCNIGLQQCNMRLQQCNTELHDGVTPGYSECNTELQPTLYNNNIYNNTIIGGGNIDTSVKQPPPPPTVEEIEAYCREIGNGIDAKRFHDYYSLRDWKWREGPITEPEKWQAVLRLWGKDKPKKEDKQEAYNGGSFDTDEFFEAALKNSYGG